MNRIQEAGRERLVPPEYVDRMVKVDPEVYQKSMDYVRLNDPNGYHLNPWTVEELAATSLYGIEDTAGEGNLLVCGTSIDKTGFLAAGFKNQELARANRIGEVLSSLLWVSEKEANGYMIGCLGKELARIYMDRYQYCAVAKTDVPPHWNPRHETDVYYLVKADYDNSAIKFDHADPLLPKYQGVFEQGIPVMRYIGKILGKASIASMVLSGELQRQRDDILRNALRS